MLETHIVSVQPNLYLISTTDENWLQNCHGGTPSYITPCKLCLIRLPFACSLKADTFYIPATLDNCNYTRLPTTIHSVNLPALLSFYGHKSQVVL